MFAAFERITAARLNRLRTKREWAQQTSSLASGAANVDVAGLTIPVTIETAGAEVTVTWFMDVDLNGSTTTLVSTRVQIVGAATYTSPNFATYAGEVVSDRSSTGNSWQVAIAAAGSYTVKIQGTTPANATINIYSSMVVEIDEVV